MIRQIQRSSKRQNEKLLLLGMSREQMEQVINAGKPSITVSVYSNYSGHIHEANGGGNMISERDRMKDISLITEELSLKEGYVPAKRAVHIYSL